MKALIASIALFSSLAAMSAETVTGPLKVWSDKKDVVVVQIQGPAAQLVFNKLSNATEQSVQQGSLTKTVRVGRDVTCESQAAIVVNYSCVLKLDSTGAIVK